MKDRYDLEQELRELRWAISHFRGWLSGYLSRDLFVRSQVLDEFDQRFSANKVEATVPASGSRAEAPTVEDHAGQS